MIQNNEPKAGFVQCNLPVAFIKTQLLREQTESLRSFEALSSYQREGLLRLVTEKVEGCVSESDLENAVFMLTGIGLHAWIESLK